MEFINITDLENSLDIKELYQESFPIEEQVEFGKLFSGVFSKYVLYAIYEKEQLISMAHFGVLDNFVHVNYLAVKKEHQRKGYGSKFLTFIKEKYNKPIVLDIEEVDYSATNSEARIRRIEFYKKNGFKDGKYKFIWEGVLMTYMNTEEVNAEEFMQYIQYVFPTIKNVTLK